MKHPGSYGHDASSEAEETSGVTSLAPVPTKTMRLRLDPQDCTQYFSVSELVDRGKAVAERDRLAAMPEPGAPALTAPPPTLPRGLGQQLRQASFARKAAAVVLLALIALVCVKPVFRPKPRSVAAPTQTLTAAPAPAEQSAPASATIATTPAAPTPVAGAVLGGLSWEKAAVDALASGDYVRALGLYRELSRHDPARGVYRDAVQVLERRAAERKP